VDHHASRHGDQGHAGCQRGVSAYCLQEVRQVEGGTHEREEDERYHDYAGREAPVREQPDVDHWLRASTLVSDERDGQHQPGEDRTACVESQPRIGVTAGDDAVDEHVHRDGRQSRA